MAKFRVGDKVKVIASVEELRRVGITRENAAGSIVVIIAIDRYFGPDYLHYSCSDGFWYRAIHLELVTNEVNALYKVKVLVKEIVDGRVMLVATYSDHSGNDLYKKEFACGENDTVNFETMKKVLEGEENER